MDADLFITIAFVLLAVVLAVAALFIARHERRVETRLRSDDRTVPTAPSA